VLPAAFKGEWLLNVTATLAWKRLLVVGRWIEPDQDCQRRRFHESAIGTAAVVVFVCTGGEC
jgi:hypothetical protein